MDKVDNITKMKEMIKNGIQNEIYVNNKLPKLCSRLSFKINLLILTTASTFSQSLQVSGFQHQNC